MSDIEYAIVGGGAVGRSIAFALQEREAEVVVLERCEKGAQENQSTRNSGVIHAGIYYDSSDRPLKAKLCVEGNKLLYAFCKDHGVAHAKTGKLVVATAPEEEDRLVALQARAIANNVPGVRLLTGEEARAMEPQVLATRALYAPSSGIIDAAAYLRSLSGMGSHNLFATEVRQIEQVAGGFRLTTNSPAGEDHFVAKTVINAAGLYADAIAQMVDPQSPYQLIAVRGESAKFYKTRRPELSMKGLNVYPVPTSFVAPGGQRVETLGVHLTPTLNEDGGIAKTVTVGPAIHSGVGKEDYGEGLHPSTYYWEKISAFFPGAQHSDLQLHQAGLQARLADHPDWVIKASPCSPRFINLIGIDSPGLTASLAIGRYVVDELLSSSSSSSSSF